MDILVTSIITLVAALIGAGAGWYANERTRKSQDAETKNKVVKALLSQATIAEKISRVNATATDGKDLGHVMPVQFPTIPFDTALFSVDSIAVSPDTHEAVQEYYAKAVELNALVYALLELPSDKSFFDQTGTFRHLNSQVTEVMPELLQKMVACLNKELKH